MNEVVYINRPMTDKEFDQMNRGFDQNSLEHGISLEKDERHGFVALEDEKFIGCVSGLAYTSKDGYNPYFYLSDLFVVKEYRRKGIGATLLHKLEQEVAGLGIAHIWTWTAEYEGADFYQNQGYTIFAEMENWYPSGHSRLGFRKKI